MIFKDQNGEKHNVLKEVKEKYPNTILEYYLKSAIEHNKMFKKIDGYEKEVSKFVYNIVKKLYSDGELMEDADKTILLLNWGRIVVELKKNKELKEENKQLKKELKDLKKELKKGKANKNENKKSKTNKV